MIGLSWHIQMQSCLLQNTLTFWLLHQNPRDVHGGNELQSPSYFTKNQHISIYARNLFIAYTQPHQPKWSNMYKKTRKWWDNQWITLLPSMQDWTVCYQHLSARFFWTRPRKGDLPCRSTNLHVWATKVLRKGSVSWCLARKMLNAGRKADLGNSRGRHFEWLCVFLVAFWKVCHYKILCMFNLFSFQIFEAER